MFHTHFESDLKVAEEYIIDSKIRVNKIFELYNISEEKRNETWKAKHEKLINELAEMNEIVIEEEQIDETINTSKVRPSLWQKLFGFK